MAAVKFSKQPIKPNPLEVDYWVDITSNPYGGRIMYHNGVDWVDLLNANGEPINMDAYYNKLQINQMLALKASVDSVESKVDDSEIADVIKNIEFKNRGDGGIEIIILKYDGATVGVTMPIASNTTSGIVTASSFKDLVKQNQLLQLYSVFYDTIANIRSQYQPRLSAGENITIDRTTNTIHAVNKLPVDWNKLTNVPDLALQPDLEKEVERATNAESILDTRITSHVTTVETSLDLKADKANTYTKDQIDSKLSGVYRIKGSCLFEQLPTDPTVGDTWNILNDFTLNGEEHPLGTNVAYTDNGWDALAGIFDSSELEGDISGVAEALAQETIRAVKAEQANADAIVAETERATKAEETLQANVDIVDGKLVNYVLKTANGDQNITNTRTHAVFNLYTTSSNTCGMRLYANNIYGGGVWTDTDKSTVYIQNNLVSSQLLGIGTNGAYFHYSGKLSLLLHEGNYSNYALPLSGGTITEGFLTIKRQPAVIRYANYANQTLGYLGFGGDANKPRFTTSDGTTSYVLWHEGNDGEGSGLDADMLDGKHLNDIFAYRGWYSTVTDINSTTHPSGLTIWNNSSTSPSAGHGTLLNFNGLDSTDYGKVQLFSGDKLFYRQYWQKWSPWKTIAFTDSDITGNAATATKLATPVALWGNTFDGSKSVRGDLYMVNATNTTGNTNADSAVLRFNGTFKNDSDDNQNIIGPSIRSISSGTYGRHRLSIFQHDANDYTTENEVMSILPNGNVGIGTNTPAYKLDVNGDTHLLNNYIDNSIYLLRTDGTYKSMISIDDGNVFRLGFGNSALNDTRIYGKNTILYYNGENIGLFLNSSGNVTIGNSDLAGSNHKLFVNGNTYSTNIYTKSVFLEKIELSYTTPFIDFHFDNSTEDYTSRIIETAPGKLRISNHLEIGNSVGIANDLLVNRDISSGNYVDWYGVSWSENDSSPTCTRIGNMALHRSLPILNAMKGYVINNTSNTVLSNEVVTPIRNDWSVTEFNILNNGQSSNAFTAFESQIMVKIPEFWYIDEYNGLTKRHNLKISQTAKAGWCHHKEAYVGAYEGYNDGTYYRSTKGVIPTVSVSRTTLRPLARANGYEDEYKWNMYTYEEHRAICHLFLVEYATRNSQAAVNTALTSDGFKQGGLGSGCTTGTVTINGVTTYSFIPTGTTDSLGNGSGQVAYTVMQTDADGNETTAVTRYANRYRGIENPFGHIWKHVDDVITQYNTSNKCRNIYKCNKPEHFATNKNVKYKVLCLSPGGTTMQGWSKEIKATINCDFFKYSVGGSETTYWCDYNYDNDDTSEHCLLIGGDSVDGGGAGLFYFALNNGVGHSDVSVGSRLTYLPWAE